MFDKDLYDSMSFSELRKELKDHDPDHEWEVIDYIMHLLNTKYSEEIAEDRDQYLRNDVDDGYDWTLED